MKNAQRYSIRISYFLLLVILLANCKKDIEPVPAPIIKEATDVNKFIFNGLKDYYLWTSVASLMMGAGTGSISFLQFASKITSSKKVEILIEYRWMFFITN